MMETFDVRGLTGLPRAVGDRTEVARPVAEVAAIIERVRRDGDAALVELTHQLDHAPLDTIAVPRPELDAALRDIDPLLREALDASAFAIANFHRSTRTESVRVDRDGIVVRQFRNAVASVGCYVPGGRATYPTSVLMTAIPARVAGVERVVLCVPPDTDGVVAPSVLAAAAIAEVDEVYSIGGAQAIAAMAHGTETVPRVDVIVGAGNEYVSEAKRQVLTGGTVGVASLHSGPSEVAVVADETASAEVIAVDLVSQLEHGHDSNAWFVTWVPDLATRVSVAIDDVISRCSRSGSIATTRCVLVNDARHAIEVVNAIAPEQLQLMTVDPESLVTGVTGAGTVFLGSNSASAIGDYIAGPSHVLPVGGAARFTSGLGIDDFICKRNVVSVDESAMARVATHVSAIAEAEGFDVHAAALTVRSRH